MYGSMNKSRSTKVSLVCCIIIPHIFQFLIEVNGVPLNFANSPNQPPSHIHLNPLNRGGPNYHNSHQHPKKININGLGKNSETEESDGRYTNKRHANSSPDLKPTFIGNNFNHIQDHARMEEPKQDSNRRFRPPPGDSYRPNTDPSPSRGRRFSPEMNSAYPKQRSRSNFNSPHIREEDFFQKNHDEFGHTHRQWDIFNFRVNEPYHLHPSPQGYYYEDISNSPQRLQNSNRQQPPFPSSPIHQRPSLNHHQTTMSKVPIVPNTKVFIQGPDGNSTAMFIEYDISDNDVTYETTVEVEEPGSDQQENDV